MKITISQEITQAIQLLPVEMQAAFYNIYFAYVTSGTLPDESVAPEVRAMFILAKPQIDRLNRAAIRKRENSEATKKPAEPDIIQIEPNDYTDMPPALQPYKNIYDKLDKVKLIQVAKEALSPLGYRFCIKSYRSLLFHALAELHNRNIRPDTTDQLFTDLSNLLPDLIATDIKSNSPWLPNYAIPHNS